MDLVLSNVYRHYTLYRFCQVYWGLCTPVSVRPWTDSFATYLLPFFHGHFLLSWMAAALSILVSTFINVQPDLMTVLAL